MKSRTILRSVLLLIVFGSLTFWLFARRPANAGGDGPDPAAVAAARVVVTYFTTDVRCDSCRTIEQLSRRAVAEGFPDELRSGALVFRVVNTDREENAHYIDEYEIGNKVVVVSRQLDGEQIEWLRCQDVWLHFGEPEVFLPYLQQPIRDYLAKG